MDGRKRSRLGVCVRLPVLLAILGVLTWYAVERKANSSAQPVPACIREAPPALAILPGSQLTTIVGASGVPDLVGKGTEDVEGVQSASAVWTDDPPPPEGAPPAPQAEAAGYEIRWWTHERAHFLADIFLFRSAADAHRFVAEAAGARCHDRGFAAAAARPAGARRLLWRNPLGFLQADVIFARDRRVYRIGQVPPAADASALPYVGPWLQPATEAVACKLPQAGCG
ncbi:MAG TPA: hypothetical protein VGI67_22535 [Thermoleophilaceae bacterium]